MGIGYQVKKYLAAKEAAKLAGDESETIELQEAEDEPMATAQNAPQPTMADVLMMFKDVIKELRQTPPSDAQATAVKQVELIERLVTKTHPENVHAPGISVYSYPEGDMAHPKPEFKCRMFWCTYPLVPWNQTPEEIELLNRLEPGEYVVTKADGLKIPFRVTAKHSIKLGADGRPTLEEMSIWFPCKGENAENHLGMVNYLRQVLDEKVPSTDELLEELTRLKKELALASAGVQGAV